MGDAGALFLGLLMATTTITVGGRTADQFTGQTYFFFAPLFIPIVILGVPILDTVFSFSGACYRRTAFHVADKDHLHHRLMRLGHATRRTVAILWLWTALLSGLVLVPTLHRARQRDRAARDRRARAGPLRRLPPRRAHARRGAAHAALELGDGVVDLDARRREHEEQQRTGPAQPPSGQVPDRSDRASLPRRSFDLRGN